MHMHGCNGAHGHGGEKKQDKKSPKWASMTCFVMYGRGKKKQEGGRYDHGDQRGARGVIEVEQGVCSPSKMSSNNKKTRKQTGGQNATPKQGHTIMSTNTTKCREKGGTKRAKNSSINFAIL